MDERLTVLLLGKTGHGKSATGNSILMEDFFDVAHTAVSGTEKTIFGATKYDGQWLTVIDTPGLSDTRIGSEVEAMKKIEKDLTDAMAMCCYGVDCFLFVLSFANLRVTKEEYATVGVLERIFSRDMFEKFCIIVYTFKDNFEKMQRRSRSPVSFDVWCRQQDGPLKSLMELCQYRCIMFDNDEPTEEQRRALVRRIRDINTSRGRYTHGRFENAAKNLRDLVEEKQYLVIKDTVLMKISNLTTKLQMVADSSGSGDEATLKEIEKDAKDLLQELRTYDNKSRVMDGIIRQVQNVVNDAKDKHNARRQAKKLQEENKRLQEKAAVEATKKKEVIGGVVGATVGGTAVGAGGAWAGAKMGAVGGSVAGPVGAAVGAGLGAFAGGVMGVFAAKKLK